LGLYLGDRGEEQKRGGETKVKKKIRKKNHAGDEGGAVPIN